MHVRGRKREARDRYVPLFSELRPSTMTRQQCERALRSSGLGVRPKDGRDSVALWCDLAGIPQGWKRALIGHRAENVTQEYGWQESERIPEDAEVKLQALLGVEKVGDKWGDTQVQSRVSLTRPGGLEPPAS